MDVDVAKLVELLKKEGPMHMRLVVKKLGKTWGAAQWVVFKAERMGLVKTARIGGFHIVYLPGQDPEEYARRLGSSDKGA